MGLFEIMECADFVLNILFRYICIVSRKSTRIVLDFLEEFHLKGRKLNAL